MRCGPWTNNAFERAHDRTAGDLVRSAGNDTGVGLYGVLAFSSAQCTREIGIRIALGSSRLGVSRLVLADVLRLVGVGIVVAIPCSVLLGQALRSQLFGVSAADPFTLGAVVLLIAVVPLVAAILPARRTSTVDPITALRTE
jgi:putative ABC transport system permease protein